MNCRIKQCVVGAGLVLVSIVGTATVMSQADRGMPEMTPEQLEGMQRWMEFMTPGEQHRKLAANVGEWELEMEWRMSPDAPPQTNRATSRARMVLGGRFLIEDVRGTLDMGGGAPMPFEGMSITGFDNQAGEWMSVWIDNTGTGMWIERGKASTDGVITTSGENYCCFDDVMKKTRSHVHMIDQNNRKMEFYAAKPGEELWKGMEIRYSRKR